MRHYGIPEKFISIIKTTYKGMTCRVLHERKTTDQFGVKTDVRQECKLSPFLFLVAIDWTTRTSTEGHIFLQCTLWEQLDDLDLALGSSFTQPEEMQEKTSLIETTAAMLELNVNKCKTNIMKINSKNNSPITLQGDVLDEVQSITYLGRIVGTNGGTYVSDVRARIGKTRAAFIVLNTIWKSREISEPIKLSLTQLLRLCLCMAYHKIHATEDPNFCK